MTRRLTSNCAKNYCNRTLIVKVIVENVRSHMFFGTRCSSSYSYCYAQEMSLILPNAIGFLPYAYVYVIFPIALRTVRVHVRYSGR